MAEAPPFDPNKPFEEVQAGAVAPPFDPSKPFEEVGAAGLGNTATDIAKSAGVGVGKGVIGLGGMAGDIRDLVTAGAEKIGISPETTRAAIKGAPIFGRALDIAPTSKQIREKVEGVTGEFYKPQTTAGGYAQSVGEFIPAAAAGPGGLARRVATQAVLPGVASEAAGTLKGIEGTKYEPWVRGAAAIASPVVAGRIISPFTTRAGRAEAVQTLRNEGVTDLTAGQTTGNRRLRYQETELGGSTAEVMMERQAEQFTAAALRRAGENANRATPEVIDMAFTRLGREFDTLSGAYTLQPEPRLMREIGRARAGYDRLVAPSQRVPAVQDTIDDIVTQFANNNWRMPGDMYQTLRSRLGADARAAARDPNLQRSLYEIQGALDNAMQRTIARVNPNDLDAWRTARRQYRNLLVVEKAAGRAGEAAASGLITPANLASATRTLHGLRNYGRGRGDFAQLARAGAEVMTPLPNSGTAQRLRAHSIPAIIGAVLGGTAGTAAGPHGTAAGIAAGLVAPRAIGEGMLRGRRLLGNRLIQERDTPGAALVRAVLARQGGG